MGRGIPADKVLMPEIDLTPKQRQFVRAMASGASKRDAYLEAYDAQADSRSVGVTACHIAAQPKIKSAIEQQRAVERLRYSQNPLDIRNFVVDSLQHEARTAQRPADRLRALELLGKLADVGAFETRSVVEHRSASDTKAKLAAKLQRLVIDVDAHPPANTQAGEAGPTPGEGAQSGGVLGGGPRSNNPHESSSKNLPPHEPSDHSLDAPEEDPHPLLKSTIPSMGGITSEEAPMEEGVGSHTGGRKKKERPIWEDPKRWYAETMGEVPKIEWQPREEAREEVQRRLNESGEDGQ
jgi:hypothetical protein